MIVIVLCAVLIAVIATLAIGTHRSRQHPGSHRETEHEGWTSAEEIRELGDAPPTPHPAAWEPVMAAPVAGQPPWDWAGGVQPDPYTWRLIHQAERPASMMQPFTFDTSTAEEDQPCASGNGHVTVAEPLAPLPPEPKPGPHPASLEPAPTAAIQCVSTEGTGAAAPASALACQGAPEPLADKYRRLVPEPVSERYRRLVVDLPRQDAIDAYLDGLFAAPSLDVAS